MFSVLSACVGMFITTRRQALFNERLKAAGQNTAEINKRVWEMLLQNADEEIK